MTRAAIMDAMPRGEMESMALTMRSITALRMLMVLMMGSAWGPREESTTAKKTEKEMMPRMLKSAAALTAAQRRVIGRACASVGESTYVGGGHALEHVEQAAGGASQATPSRTHRNPRLSNGSTTFPGWLSASTSLLPPPQEPEPRSFPSPGRMVVTLKQRVSGNAV